MKIFWASLATSLDVVDLVLLEEEFDALCQPVNCVGLLRHHRVEIDLELAGLDTHCLEIILRRGIKFRRVQQGFRGDAADIETGAAQNATVLDAGRLQAELSGADCAIVAAGAATDNDDVVCLSHGEICLA